MELKKFLWLSILIMLSLSIMSCPRMDLLNLVPESQPTPTLTPTSTPTETPTLTPTATPTPDPTADPAIVAGINKALSWLKSQQTLGDITSPEYGSWSNSLALTSFAVLALCNQGERLVDPDYPQNAVDRGIRYIIRNISGINPNDYLVNVAPVYVDESGFTHRDGNEAYRYAYGTDVYAQTTRTYTSAMAITALAATGNHAYDSIIKALGTFLIHSQWDFNSIVGSLINQDESVGGIRTFGGFGYGVAGLRADNSNTQFALMGIKVAKDFLDKSPDSLMQLKLPSTFFRYLLVWIQRTQNPTDLGFSYTPTDAGYTSSTNVMTAAVLWDVTLFKSDLEVLAPSYRNFEDNAVEYLKTRFSLDFGIANTYYYAFTLAKAILASGRTEVIPDELGNWYNYLANELLNRQSTDGSWSYNSWLSPPQKNYIMNTIFALLALEMNQIPANPYNAFVSD